MSDAKNSATFKVSLLYCSSYSSYKLYPWGFTHRVSYCCTLCDSCASCGAVISEPLEFAYKHYLPFIYLGSTFIAISGKEGLVIIDYHAAHERILYEKFLNKILNNICIIRVNSKGLSYELKKENIFEINPDKF